MEVILLFEMIELTGTEKQSSNPCFNGSYSFIKIFEKDCEIAWYVLILVLMEVILLYAKVIKACYEKLSSNPCFNGSYSFIIYNSEIIII